MKSGKPTVTLAVDFDGVIHSYSKGWNNGLLDNEDPLMPGCADALRSLSKRYRMVVFTARHDLGAVRTYLLHWHILPLFDDITNRKPVAAVYLDDRAMRFESWQQALGELVGA